MLVVQSGQLQELTGTWIFTQVGKPVPDQALQSYPHVLCRILTTACVCLQCSSEFEGNAVFRVDVWNKTILTVASFLELLISFQFQGIFYSSVILPGY